MVPCTVVGVYICNTSRARMVGGGVARGPGAVRQRVALDAVRHDDLARSAHLTRRRRRVVAVAESARPGCLLYP